MALGLDDLAQTGESIDRLSPSLIGSKISEGAAVWARG